jgi:AraC-like DNA-binding protein
VQNPRLAINETALMLGFAEVSAFHRAFKCWLRATPVEYPRTARKA